jgi:ABC-type transporter Mla subunit MlaD
MSSSFDTDPRSPSLRKLLIFGVCFILIGSLVVTGLFAKSRGQFDRLVRVSVSLMNVGDGLPTNSDVKFRGILVGFVSAVTPATVGQNNTVHVSLRREFAAGVPQTVTARVVPSNVFAVSSVELIDHGPGAPIKPGAVIPEDTSLSTVLFQTFLEKLRQVLAAVGRTPAHDTVGALTALGEAVEGKGPKLREAAGDLKKIVAELNEVVASDTGPSTLAAFAQAATGLKNVAPTLYDALDKAVAPARTLAEKGVALTTLLSAGLKTTGTLRQASDNQTDRLINITTQLSPVVGVLADNAHQFHPIARSLQNLADRVLEVWDPRLNTIKTYTILSLTPFRQYVRADCPRYGELLGPSCSTAPETPTAPDLLPALASMGYPPDPSLTENRSNLAPPRDSVGSVGRFDEPGAVPPVPTPPGNDSPLPAEVSPPPAAAAPVDAQPQSATVGTIGPVGSQTEKDQLSQIVGGPANAATVLMLGPVVRGTTVSIAPTADGVAGSGSGNGNESGGGR